MLNGRSVVAGRPNSSKYECAMYSPASFETAYVQRASPTEPPLVTCVSSTRYARVPKTSLVEKSTNRSRVDCVACAASSALYVPIKFTRIVRTGLSSTASTPAIATISASLHITVWPQGADGARHSWTLRCNPVAGTLPHRATACARLAKIAHPFAPVPPGLACSDIYGRPQTAC